MDPLETSPQKNHGKPFEARPLTIFRLPGWFHENNKHLCEPNIVAIGPYHHGEKSLQAFEEHKWYTLRDFLARSSENVGLPVYCEAIQSIEAQARQCYSEAVNLKSDIFAMMLLLDGCFFLEWFLKLSIGEKDVICDVGWAANTILYDMLLSENQVPFFVIHKLWTTHIGWSKDCNNDPCRLLELISGILEDSYYCRFKRPPISCNDIHHLLHFYYLGVVSDSKLHPLETLTNSHNIACGLGCCKLFSKSRKGHSQMNIPSVTVLHNAGVKFKRKMEACNMFDISFEDGTIHMPFLEIYDINVGIWWNMVVLEQSRRSWDFPQILSSYLWLMDSLINTKNDIAILEQAGIVDNYFQDGQEAADFFNLQFSNNFLLDYSDHHFQDLVRNVKSYSESTWHTHRARLMHDYCSNPWSIISIVAATTLLVLTFIQTYFSAAR